MTFGIPSLTNFEMMIMMRFELKVFNQISHHLQETDYIGTKKVCHNCLFYVFLHNSKSTHISVGPLNFIAIVIFLPY